MRSTLFITVAAIAFGGLIFWDSTFGQAPQRIAEPKWEYKVLTLNGIPQDHQLNEFGDKKWEFVTLTPDNAGNMSAVFKRVNR